MTANVLRTLERGLDLLSLYCDHPDSISLEYIMEKLQVPRSTAYRMVAVLRDRGFLRTTGVPGQFDLGYQLCHLARIADSRLNLGAIARPVMRELVSEVNEAALILVRSGLNALCIEEVQSSHTVQVRFNTGLPLPLYAGAAAKVVLAFMSDRDQDKALAGKLPALSQSGYLNKKKLREELVRIRKTGVAMSCGDVLLGVVAVSVPIFAADQSLLGGLTVAGAQARMPKDRCASLVKPLRAAADRIGESYSRAARVS